MARWTQVCGRVLVVAVGTVAVLGGCAKPVERVETPLVYGSIVPSTTAVTAPPTPEQRAAGVVAAYRHSWSTVLTAYAESSVVGLHRVISGPVLWGISDDILHGINYGLVLDGTMTHHPRIEVVEDVRAVLIDCMLVEDQVSDSLTGELLGEGAQWIELEVEMLFDGDAWKMHDYQWLADDCVPPAPQA